MAMDVKALLFLLLLTVVGAAKSAAEFRDYSLVMTEGEVMTAEVMSKTIDRGRHATDRDYELSYRIPALGPEHVGWVDVTRAEWVAAQRGDTFELYYYADWPARSFADPAAEMTEIVLWTIGTFLAFACSLAMAVVVWMLRSDMKETRHDTWYKPWYRRRSRLATLFFRR